MLIVQLFVTGVVTGCALGIVSISFSLIYSTTGIFHIAHAGVYTLGGYVAWSLYGRGWPIALAAAMSMAVCAVVGVLIHSQLYERLRERGASPLTTLVASLGVLAMLQSLLAAIYTPDVLTFPSPDMISVGAFNFTPTQIVTVVVAIAVYALVQFLLTRTDFGRRVRAVAANPTLAAIAGLSPQLVYIQVFALSSALAGLASVLTALDFGIQPYTGTYILLTASVAMIAGGRRSITGAFLVAIAISVLQSEFILVLPGDWGVACTFFVFLVFMLFRPEGLFRPRGSRS